MFDAKHTHKHARVLCQVISFCGRVCAGHAFSPLMTPLLFWYLVN